MKCICCNKEINLVERTFHRVKNYTNCPPEQNMWDGGVVDRILAGYGSIYDNGVILICVCDKCLTKYIKETNQKI